MNALRRGQQEEIKALAHAAIGVPAAIAAVYNACAFVDRDDVEWHLLLNTGLYSLLAVLEARRVREHWQAR